jgi:hypothetical protein
MTGKGSRTRNRFPIFRRELRDNRPFCSIAAPPRMTRPLNLRISWTATRLPSRVA